jgi:hypothetical protein
MRLRAQCRKNSQRPFTALMHEVSLIRSIRHVLSGPARYRSVTETASSSTSDQLEEARAIRQIERLGGKVERDEKLPVAR